MEQRDFKGVWIPREIWLDERLNMIEKGILTEIDSLDNENGCSASNEYLADFCQCSETKVSTAIKKLIELGFVYQQSFNGRVRILKSRLTKFERQTYKNCKAELQKMQVNNINNNINNNNIGVKRFTPPTLEEVSSYCEERQNGVDAQRFIDFYASKGWKVGNQGMKDWKACVRTWEQREKKVLPKNYDQRRYTKDELNGLFTNLDEVEI